MTRGNHSLLTDLLQVLHQSSIVLNVLPSIVSTGSNRLQSGLRPPRIIYVKNNITTDAQSSGSQFQQQSEQDLPVIQNEKKQLVAAKVPSSRVSRLVNYGQLGLSIGVNMLRGQSIKSSDNLDTIVSTLSRMRGAALKLGQMLSLQDSEILPEEWRRVLVQLQNQAYYVPFEQVEPILIKELGSDQRSVFQDFEETPRAAASIGQVHYASFKSPSGLIPVAVKIQYPNVAKSIISDLSTLKLILLASKLLPKGLFLDKTLEAARKELLLECDYRREAQMMIMFSQHLDNDQTLTSDTVRVTVPKVFADISSDNVLVSEWKDGITFGNLLSPSSARITQQRLNAIGQSMLKLCLNEIFTYNLMQTDPNWSNFLYNQHKNEVVLLDFGSSKSFDDNFVSLYRQLLISAVDMDRDSAIKLSQDIGYLTGYESQMMINAHLNSLFTLAVPFRKSGGQTYDFGRTGVTTQVRSEIPIMLEHRLTPPPEETYTLHRKLSGIFLLCQRLGCRFNAAQLFDATVRK
ncbi:hypothetical protein MIR68_006402 [Amoeboaphelidium protococcarum]|nr:hypothetical protein MIR68_006402 [Amoeboaphelidium protococcarum]